MNKPRIAIVCDFLTSMGGAENVVLAMHEAFPEAPIYTAIYNPEKVPAFAEIDIRTSYLQKIPAKIRKFYKLFPTLSVRAMRKLDLSEFDVILTSSYLHGHQVTKTRPDQIVINYCHTPPRYYWSHYDEYRRDPGYGKLNPLVRILMPMLVPHQRKLDLQAAKKVDVFIANSSETQRRIYDYYGRKSTVIHPPVDVAKFTPSHKRGDHYVTIGRQLPYKRYDLVIEACNELGLELHVFGNGPSHQNLVKIAGPTIHFHTDRFGDASDETMINYLNTAKGFIYATEEDFGIVTVEALAAGTPVIAYGKAGTLDIVTSDEIGSLFPAQTVSEIVTAIKKAEQTRFFPSKLNRTAKRFDKVLFINKLKKVVYSNMK